MGEGKCGVRNYANITKEKVTLMLTELKEQGFTVKGSNPWSINTNKFGVVLQGTWIEPSSTLRVIVSDKSFLAPCGTIWNTIDPLLNGLSNTSKDDLSQHVD